MSKWDGFFSSVLEDIVEVGDDSDLFESTELGVVKDFGRLDFPAVHVIPDRSDYTGNGEYEIPIIVNLYFEKVRGREDYIDFMRTMESFIDEVQTKLEKNGNVVEWKPVNINHYPGEFENTLLAVIEVEWRVKQMQKF